MKSAFLISTFLIFYVANINGQLNLITRIFGLREPFKPTKTIPSTFEDKKLYCEHPKPNYHSRELNRDFWLSWRCGPAFQFTAEEIGEVCQNNSMQAVSLDDPRVARVISRVLIQDGGRYFWTGGIINHTLSQITWPNGVVQDARELKSFFSHTGATGRPQPDNRELVEYCLAVLNSFFGDGLKLHDVSCDYKKPIVCEVPPKPKPYSRFNLFNRFL